jgi:hypothetical protein
MSTPAGVPAILPNDMEPVASGMSSSFADLTRRQRAEMLALALSAQLHNNDPTTLFECVASPLAANEGRARSVARTASQMFPTKRICFAPDATVAVYIKRSAPNVLYVDPLAPSVHSLNCVAFLDKNRYLNFLPLYFTWQKLKEAMVVADTIAVEVLASMIESRLARSWF